VNALAFFCPSTGREIDPGIEDAESIPGAAAVRFSALHVRCPHCGEHHELRIDETTLDEAAA